MLPLNKYTYKRHIAQQGLLVMSMDTIAVGNNRGNIILNDRVRKISHKKKKKNILLPLNLINHCRALHDINLYDVNSHWCTIMFSQIILLRKVVQKE